MGVIIYLILAYWATGQTIYKNHILIGSTEGIFMKRVITGAILGFVLIPIAIISTIIRMLV